MVVGRRRREYSIVVVISRLINSYISAWDYGDRAVVMVVDFAPSNEG